MAQRRRRSFSVGLAGGGAAALAASAMGQAKPRAERIGDSMAGGGVDRAEADPAVVGGEHHALAGFGIRAVAHGAGKIFADEAEAHAGKTVTGTMLRVELALVPATLFSFWLYGWPSFLVWALTLASCAGFEALCLRLSHQCRVRAQAFSPEVFQVEIRRAVFDA